MATINQTIGALRIQVDDMKVILDNLVTTWNNSSASKKDVERLKTEIILLKSALERGDYVIDTTTASTIKTLEDKVAIAANARSLLEDVQSDITTLETRMDTLESTLSQLSIQVGALVVKVEQYLITN